MGKVLANFFYEQCAGSFAGHMAMIPNNPTLYALMTAHTGSRDNHHACTKAEFAEILEAIAADLRADEGRL